MAHHGGSIPTDYTQVHRVPHIAVGIQTRAEAAELWPRAVRAANAIGAVGANTARAPRGLSQELRGAPIVQSIGAHLSLQGNLVDWVAAQAVMLFAGAFERTTAQARTRIRSIATPHTA